MMQIKTSKTRLQCSTTIIALLAMCGALITPYRSSSASAAGYWTMTVNNGRDRTNPLWTALPDGRAFRTGGYSTDPKEGNVIFRNSAHIYVPESGSSIAVTNMLTARGRHSATPLADGRILVVGGRSYLDPNTDPYTDRTLATSEIYDPSTNAWSASASLNQARSSHANALLADGRILVTGGIDQAYDRLTSTEIYDPLSNSWSAGVPYNGILPGPSLTLPDGRVLFAAEAALLPDGRVLSPGYSATIFDPVTNAWTSVSIASRWPASVGIFDPILDSWSDTSPAPVNLSRLVGVLGSGRVLLIGTGANETPSLIYDPGSDAWSEAGGVPAYFGGAWWFAMPLIDGRLFAIGDRARSVFDETLNPIPSVGPDSLAFGETLIGTPEYLTLRLSNVGTYPFRIENIQASGIAFSHVTDVTPRCIPTRQVRPGTACGITIRFAPDEPVSTDGNLTITTDAPDGTLVVPMHGVGVANADLQFTMTDTHDPVLIGGQIEYHGTVTNRGPSVAEDVVLTDTLSNAVQLVSASVSTGTCTGTTTITCDLGDMAPDAVETIDIIVLAPTTGVVINGSLASSSTLDPGPYGNGAQVRTLVTRTLLTSRSTAGVYGEQTSRSPSMSGDGVEVAFQSSATNLVDGDTNGFDDIFVRNRVTYITEKVSRTASGTQANGASRNPSISLDGRYVVFESTASNLVPGDTNGLSDIFMVDRSDGTVSRVSVNSGEVGSNGSSTNAAISEDSRRVVFQSNATNLIPTDTNRTFDIFVRDLSVGTTRRVSVASGGAQANGSSTEPSISRDGAVIAFQSNASNLVAGDTNTRTDIFVRDLGTNATTRASLASNGTQSNGTSAHAAISPDGSTVAYDSSATNLIGGDTNDLVDVFVWRRSTGLTERVSTDSDGSQAAEGQSSHPALSVNGRYVLFASEATNLIDTDTNLQADLFLHDRVNDTTTRVSLSELNRQGTEGGVLPGAVISGGGRFIAFASSATNLVSGDINASADVFIRQIR